VKGTTRGFLPDIGATGGNVRIILGQGYGTDRVFTSIGEKLIPNPTIGTWQQQIKNLRLRLSFSDWYLYDNLTCWIDVEPTLLQKFLGLSDEEFTAFLLENA
jgi:hypothetical protein